MKLRTRPEWWPENPYPEDIFPLTRADYVKLIPDPKKRTAISGCIGRFIWEIASESIYNAYLNWLEEQDDE